MGQEQIRQGKDQRVEITHAAQIELVPVP